jgi:hypothetical protein
MLDEAANLVLNYPAYIQRQNWKRCAEEVLTAFRRSAAFLELKLFIFDKFMD